MRLIYAYITFLLISNSIFAQIPAGYYNTATGTGYTLKTQLHLIIDNHTALSYTPGLWNLYSEGTAWKDNWYENNGTILDMYSENPIGTDAYEYTAVSDQCGGYSGEGDCYNREHIIPQSVFNEQSPMVTDAFHIWPTDGKVNGMRSNYPFGEVDSPTWTSTNGSKLGPNLNSGYSAGYTGTVFDPIDEFKGDIARAYFYFATRYESEGVATWTYAMFNGTNNQVFTNTFKTILLTWHQNDQVSAREIAINESIYAKQHNRNPYIDHPEYVASIWGTVAGTEDEMLLSLKIYPNPSNDVIYIESDELINDYTIFDITGKKVQDGTIMNNQIQVDVIESGLYFLNLSNDNNSIIKKIVVID